MNSGRFLHFIELVIISTVVAIISCSSPLMDIVKEEVEVVTTPPVVTSVFPADDAENIPITTDTISATFSKTISSSSVTSSTFYLTDPDGNSVSGTITVSNDTISLSPNSALTVGSVYTSVIDGIKDNDGNVISSRYEWTFTTGIEGDTVAPEAAGIIINNDDLWTTSRTVSISIDASDNFGVAQMNISFNGSFPDSGWTAFEETSSIEMPPEEGLKTVSVKVKDGSGNISGIISDEINMDTIMPEIEFFRINFDIPATNSNTVNMDMTALDSGGSGPYQYRYRESGETWGSWIDLSVDGHISDPAFSLNASDGDTKLFEAQVSDIAGNISEISNTSILYELTPPVVDNSFPDTNTSDYPSNSGQIYISFSEAMNPNSFDVDNFYLTKGNLEIKGESVLYVIVDENKIYPDNTVLLTGLDLEQGVEYEAILDISATDDDGNPIAPPADTAGNTLEESYSWVFSTSDAIDTDPPVGTIYLDTANPAHPTDTTTNNAVSTLKISASDQYNAPYGIKIWGDNNDPLLAAFEDDAAWEQYTVSKPWTFSSGDGVKYIYYKFMDAAANETETPNRLKVNLDAAPPVFGAEGIQIDGGATYTNNQELTVELSIDADDATSGINVMTITITDINGSTVEEFPWQPVSTITLPDGDGDKTISLTLTDHTENVSVASSAMITLDLTSPEIVLGELNELEVNSPTAQPGAFIDMSPISSYFWEAVSGPGIINFNGTETAASPTVSADTDGTYEIQVTVEDAAGNISVGSIPFLWDTTAPGSPVGTAPAVTTSQYSTTVQPEWTWNDVENSFNYRVSFAAAPDWDTPDPAGSSGYIISPINSFSPQEGLTEGLHTLQVRAYDKAGNYTATGSAGVTVDTIDPVINNDGTYYLKNALYNIDNSSMITENGSGIATSTWTTASGPGILTFSDENGLVTDISADTDGTYTINLTVEDSAGNSATAEYTLDWDTTPPNTPSIDGLTHTPNVGPTWNWESNGEGNGNFTYRLERQVRAWESEGGDLSGSVEPVFDWTAPAPVASYKHGSLLDDRYEYTLYIRELDDAGNESAIVQHSIWIDTDYVSEPALSRDGNPLRNATETSVSWTWESGSGTDTASDYYRYRLNGAVWTETANNGLTLTLTHGTYTFEVEEQNVSNTTWIGLIASSSVEIDTVYPTAPPISAATPTNDRTPTFSWNSGSADGVGIYKFRFDNGGGFGAWSDETQAVSYTHTTSLPDATNCVLEVIERDEAGNWSSAASKTVIIDITAPVPGTITIDSDATYTTDTSVTLSFSATGATQMQFCNYSSSNGWGTWSAWETYGTSKTFTLTSGDELKYALVKFRDAAGNVSGYIFDTITLDTTPPVFSSFNINNGSSVTTSRSTTLNSSVSGANYMRFQNSSGSWSGWYTYSSSLSWSITGTTGGGSYGARRVNAEYKDAAGNTITGYHDAIFYGNPVLKYASKGAYDDGYIRAYYDGANYTSESGMATNKYYVYSSTTSTGSKTGRGNTTNTSYYQMSGMTEGTIYYIFMRVYNSEIGYSNYSGYAYGFTSDITIIYDDDDSADITVAQNMKNLLTWTTFPSSYSSYVSGTMPTWTVTMFPEDFISSSWYSSDDRYIIYGSPTILTPSTTIYSSTNKSRNVTHKSIASTLAPATVDDSYTTTVIIMGIPRLVTIHKYRSGVVAMGYYGSKYLEKVADNAAAWGIDNSSNYKQSPYSIDAGNCMLFSTPTDYAYQWTTSNSVWSSPLTSTLFVGGTTPSHNQRVYLSYTDMGGAGVNLYRSGVYLSGGAIPVNGDILLRDDGSASHFPVVRQGRFMHFGLPHMPDRPYTGKVFFVNTMALMDNY